MLDLNVDFLKIWFISNTLAEEHFGGRFLGDRLSGESKTDTANQRNPARARIGLFL